MLLDWVEALAATAGAIFGGIALYLSHKANTVAQEVREDALEQANRAEKLEIDRDNRARLRNDQLDRKQKQLEDEVRKREAVRDQREVERERRAMAASIQAWWVCSEDSKTWGVVVANSTTGAVFRDVLIHLDGNIHADTLKMEVVPPGQFFVETASHANPRLAWELPCPLTTFKTTLHPITRGKKKQIKSISFIDQLNSHWEWTPESGLTKVSH